MDEDLYDDHAIITPPKISLKDIPVRKNRYIIDSRDRNTKRYPNPSKYTIELEESLTDVISAELVLTDFKFNKYNITNYNNILHTSSGDYTLTPGIYTGSSLASELETQTGLTVTFSDITQKLTITPVSGVTLNFKSLEQKQYDYNERIDVYPRGSIGKLLGFGIFEYDLDAGVAFEAPFSIDLETSNYIIMFMQQAKVIKSRNNVTHNAFAIINKLENSSNGLVMHDNVIKKSFNPPIADLRKLVFKFVDYDGNLYDFQNKDHRFEIVFTTLKQTRCYDEIFK